MKAVDVLAQPDREDAVRRQRRALEMYDRAAGPLLKLAARMPPAAILIRDGVVEIAPHPLLPQIEQALASAWAACCRAAGLPPAPQPH